MSLRGMYNCTVEVYRATIDNNAGSMKTSWVKLTGVLDPLLGIPGEMKCRIDLGYLRPGKDAPSPIAAGRSPDRTGVMLFDYTPLINAGDRIKIKFGHTTGTFEIKAWPDPAVGYDEVHHLEVQVVEVARSAA